jgi:signal transduction histidine kinase
LEFFVKPEEMPEGSPARPVKIGVAMVGISMASANRRMQEAQRTAIITTFIIILIGIFVTYFMVGAIVTPIRKLAQGTQIVARGDLNHRVSIKTRDEIGDLGNAFNKMTEDLKASQSQLIQAEKMEIVGRLASGIAHEVKNPLAIILQCVEYLVKNIVTEDKNVSLTLGYIKDAVKRADNVIRGLLDFSGSSRLDIKVASLNPVIERALVLLKHLFDKYHIKIIKDLREDIPDVEMDENRIEQVFVNLFLNAVSAMPGGGRLKVMSYAQKQEGKADSVVVRVEDTGTGIPEEILGKIFDPFFTTRRNEGGTGLGLSVVKNIIELHEAKISIQNGKEGGVIVILTFKS